MCCTSIWIRGYAPRRGHEWRCRSGSLKWEEASCMREIRGRMREKGRARSWALLVGLLIVLSGTVASVGLQHAGTARGESLKLAAARGGVFRTAATTMSAIANLDPVGENNPYLSYELLAAMQKTLVGFNGSSTKLYPQLATSIPKP